MFLLELDRRSGRTCAPVRTSGAWPILLAYGAWAGYAAAGASGSFVAAIVVGAVLGILPLMLDTVGFGLILGRGFEAGLLAGIFGFSMVLFGSLLGGGYRQGTVRAGNVSR